MSNARSSNYRQISKMVQGGSAGNSDGGREIWLSRLYSDSMVCRLWDSQNLSSAAIRDIQFLPFAPFILSPFFLLSFPFHVSALFLSLLNNRVPRKSIVTRNKMDFGDSYLIEKILAAENTNTYIQDVSYMPFLDEIKIEFFLTICFENSVSFCNFIIFNIKYVSN